ncbi:GUN4 N-terminal ARM-like repeat domain-containing protein [Leptothoe sp. PORK10 BA2]|uniref:GUN4 N-terminal ARM-like repeat domain-containing protein n=1 Tax=Leptothoe sp. PORK10 BA2 TaxID=3110254 RepID=UPI002B20B985|nr:GUN4 N-terminal ARM-like repeat domain-containing protein [Leptothoe sp. PORK10 BA2]MEA5466205.1 GUN4 N-terminal ARM-like repeat domain-containing protein [Leptothoe sp. PORK10 BA2]
MSNVSADSPTATPRDSDQTSKLAEQLLSQTLKRQLNAATELASMGESGIAVLINFLKHTANGEVSVAAGKTCQLLSTSESVAAQTFLAEAFPNGIVPVSSDCGVDYQPLQGLLIAQEFEAADRITLQKLCELAGPAAMQRKWVYFTEVDSFPAKDLLTIDQLWRVYSEDRFGFSKQRELWLSLNQNWDRLWEKLAWKSGNIWTRYPGEFVWDVSAPVGHLPLSNQLRGVRMMEFLLSHPAWTP